MKIALIDYGAGNLTSVKTALAAIGADVFVPDSSASLGAARGVIVPGVGHFGATRALGATWVDAILAHVGEGRPLLGICLGMQWLFEGSAEAPGLPGLGVMAGRCLRLGGQPGGADQAPAAATAREAALKVPHVGWNSLERRTDASIVDGVPGGSQVYFTHSYAAPITPDTVATTDHGGPFASIVQRAHIAGVQFHPEKSGDAGLRILRNFVRAAG